MGEAAVGLEVAADHDRVVRLDRLRHPVDEGAREAEGEADLPDRRAGPVGDDVADHAGVLGPVSLVDVLDDLLPPGRREVDVDVRVRRPALVDEALEEEVVADRVDPGDAEDVGDDGIGGTPPPLGRDPPPAGEGHEVPADEEELGEPGPFDDVELVGELPDDGRGEGVVAPPGSLPAEARKVAEGGLPGRDREAREAVSLEAEVDRTGRGELGRRSEARPPGAGDGRRVRRGREGGELRLRLQVALPARASKGAEGVEGSTVADGRQDVVELAVLGPGVVDVVRDDDRQAELVGEADGLGDSPVVVGEEMVVQLEEEAAPGHVVGCTEEAGVPLGSGSGTGPIAGHEAPRDLALPAAGEDDEPLGVGFEEGVVEAGHALRAGQVRPGDEATEAPVPRRRSGQQNEMRASALVGDAPEVRPKGRPMTGQAGSVRAEAGGPAVDRLVDEEAVRPSASGPAGERDASAGPERRCRQGPERPDRRARPRRRRPGGGRWPRRPRRTGRPRRGRRDRSPPGRPDRARRPGRRGRRRPRRRRGRRSSCGSGARRRPSAPRV
ncbi:MAG: hypothetical protein KatS3mg065_0144 [Chloroflexota bacterium]|nr:MAG: hypothetical protein KatS3mg065_0144 [Chloroflexota bacterium]